MCAARRRGTHMKRLVLALRSGRACAVRRARRRRAGSHFPQVDGVPLRVAERQARDLCDRRSGGRGRRVPFHRAGARRLQGLDRRRRRSVRHFARLPPGRPDQIHGQVRAGRRRVPPPPLAVLQEDADRARLRHEAQRARLHGLFGPADRRLAEELDLDACRSCRGARATFRNARIGWRSRRPFVMPRSREAGHPRLSRLSLEQILDGRVKPGA